MTQSDQAIQQILHDGLDLNKVKNSNHVNLFQENKETNKKSGAVFLTRTKTDLTKAKGFVSTSVEGILDNSKASHWTPNIFRFGTYADAARRIIKGHAEDNLKQINAFVVDADFGLKKPKYNQDLLSKFVINLGFFGDRMLWPTMVLETPHGYQAYYILHTPVFIKRGKDGKLKAVTAAKHVSEAIRSEVAQQLPQVDQGANHFGFFRKPAETNVVFYEPALTADFAELLDWSKNAIKSSDDANTLVPSRLSHKGFVPQVKQPWFNVLANAQVPNAEHGCLGRNNTLLTLLLATYSSGWTQEQGYNFADEWNSRQHDPISDQEVQRIVKSAYSGKYQGATRQFINELMDSYGRGQAAFVTNNHNWVKWAKPREERKYSHTHEWIKDIAIWLNGQTPGDDGFVRTTTRKLQTTLGMKPATLMIVLNTIQDLGLMRIKRVRGPKGGLYLASWQQVGREIVSKRQEDAQAWITYLGLESADQVAFSQAQTISRTQPVTLALNKADPGG